MQLSHINYSRDKLAVGILIGNTKLNPLALSLWSLTRPNISPDTTPIFKS